MKVDENTGNDKGKVFNLAEQRRRRKTLGSNKSGGRGKQSQNLSSGSNKIWLYIQVLIFLLVIWLMMKSCHF